jgi:aspartate/glutamate racemase
MLAFLHTAAPHVETFERLVREQDAAVPTRHAVDAALLEAARAAGAVTPALAGRVDAAVRALADGGARLVVCTCSTIGGAAEAARAGVPVLRIDRPMAERAVALATRVGVVAALASTLAPTAALLQAAARAAGRPLVLTEVVCGEAWPLFERGALEEYYDAVAAAAERAARGCEVVVLAQGSMGPAAARARCAVPVLSSPRSGVTAALLAYRALPGA